jgi:glycosyltransferase involved in cell wall biosynthesis
MTGLVSIVVTTFNREDALDAVLRSLSRQHDRGFEVLVADDGSGPDTAGLIERWKLKLGVSLTHVRHEHHGFRAGEIRNRALLVARGDIVVFLDGDCLARPDFVGTHRRLAEPGWFVTGNRALLSETLTVAVLRGGLEAESWGIREWVRRWRDGGLNRLAPVLRLPLGPLRKLRPRQWQGARSCNLAVWRSDLDTVDGFDAGFSGWGKEDSDLLVRLVHAGVRRKDGACATGVLHLWHPEADRSRLSQNEKRLEAVVNSERVKAEWGLSSLRR